MISGSEVIDPCPISVAGDMMVIVPSAAMLTHGLSALPVRSRRQRRRFGAPVDVERNGEAEAGRADHHLATGQAATA